MGTHKRLLGIRRGASALGLILLVVLGVGAECQTPKPSDGGTVRDLCQTSCINQRRLSCPGASGKDSPKGVHCEDVCIDQTDKGVDLHSKCITEAVDCKAILACFGQ